MWQAIQMLAKTSNQYVYCFIVGISYSVNLKGTTILLVAIAITLEQIDYS